MALNFPDAPTDNQVFTDTTTGEQWKYELTTNSWTSLGLTTSGGIIYKGGLDITAAPPTGVASGWTYIVTKGGTTNAGFTGLSSTVGVGTQVTFDGARWQASAGAGEATTTSKGVVQLADAAAVTAGTAGVVVDAAQLKAATPVEATAAVKGLVQLADLAAVTAGTAGRVIDAAQLKAAVAEENLWNRAGTVVTPTNAGDVIDSAALPFVFRELSQVLVNAAFSVGTAGAIPFGVGPVPSSGTAFAGLSFKDYMPIHLASGSFC